MLCEAQSGLSGGGLDDLVSPLFALLAQRPAHQALVVDHQDFLSRHAFFSLLRKGRRGHAGGKRVPIHLQSQKPMRAKGKLRQLYSAPELQCKYFHLDTHVFRVQTRGRLFS